MDGGISFWRSQGFEFKECGPEHAERWTPRRRFGVMWIVVLLAAEFSVGTQLIPMVAMLLVGIYLEQRGIVRLTV